MPRSPQTPKEILTTLVGPLVQLEATIKKPFIDAGFPDIPTPAQMGIRMAEALPEMPAFPAALPTLPFLAPTKPAVVEERVRPELVVRYG